MPRNNHEFGFAHDEAIAVMLWAGPAAEATSELSPQSVYIGERDASLMERYCPDRTKQARARETAVAFVKNHEPAVRLVAVKLIASPARTLSAEQVEAYAREAGLS
jgi:hypothetical protein